MDDFAKVLGWIAIVAASVLYGGWVVLVFWRWFALPLFPSLPHIDLAHAISLRMLAAVLFPTTITKTADDYSVGMRAAITFALITFTLAMGWIVHLFV